MQPPAGCLQAGCCCLLHSQPYLPSIVYGVIPEAWQVCCDELHQAHSRLLCCCHQLSCLALEVLLQGTANLPGGRGGGTGQGCGELRPRQDVSCQKDNQQ